MSNLRKIELLDFFEKTGYDWRKDLEVMRTICGLTKTRPKENMSEFKFTDGHEQTFFMKACTSVVTYVEIPHPAHKFRAEGEKYFFEKIFA